VIRGSFLFTTCQPGFEAALKAELGTHERRAAFQRPGFVTFKTEVAADIVLDAIFAHTYGASLDRLSLKEAQDPRSIERVLGGDPDVVHVYARDPDDPLLADAARAISLPWPAVAAEPGELVADVIVVEPAVVYVGAHVHHGDHSPHAGARPPLVMPEEAPSRAWLKLEDALHRFDLSLRPGEVAIEIGSAPGGAAYALCSRGLFVFGVDPAEMSPRVSSLTHPNGEKLFTHVQKPFAHVGRRDLPKRADLLLLDVNVVPSEAAQMVEKCLGMLPTPPRTCLLTFKLGSPAALREIPAQLQKLRALGYRDVRARQLASSHKEAVVCARR
jgi:23S rRNA (cytidine2498-2'-O)-methyltransferase